MSAASKAAGKAASKAASKEAPRQLPTLRSNRVSLPATSNSLLYETRALPAQNAQLQHASAASKAASKAVK